MSSHTIRRILVLATIVAAAFVDAEGKNFADMAAGLLRDSVTGYRQISDSKVHVIVLFNDPNARLSDLLLRAPNEVEARQEQASNDDVYTQLAGFDLADSNRTQCVILVDLEPHQTIAAEQYGRDFHLVVAAVRLPFSPDIDRGGVPFIFDWINQEILTRNAAIERYGLKWTSRPPKGVKELTRDVDSCPPLAAEDQDAYPYVACHDNAYARMTDKKAKDRLRDLDKASLQDGLRDLDAAVGVHFDEEYDTRSHPRVWGLKGYYPHIGVAYYMSQYGNCRAAKSELKIARARVVPKDKVAQQAETKVLTRCPAALVERSLPASIGAGGGEPELLPPFRQPPLWLEIALLR
jgi:hypothetical protein